MLFCRPCSTGVLNVGSPCECFMIWWCLLDFIGAFGLSDVFLIRMLICNKYHKALGFLDGWFLLMKYLACVEFKLSCKFSIFLWFYNDAPVVFPFKNNLSWALQTWIEVCDLKPKIFGTPGMVELDWDNFVQFQAVLDTKMCRKWIQLIQFHLPVLSKTAKSYEIMTH